MSRLSAILLRDLALEGGIGVRVRGDCMAPAIPDGATVLVRVRHPWPGDVVLVRAAHGGLLAHRFLGAYRWRGEWRAVTRGDSASRPDSPSLLRDVVGVVDRDVPASARFLSALGFLRWCGGRFRRFLEP